MLVSERNRIIADRLRFIRWRVNTLIPDEFSHLKEDAFQDAIVYLCTALNSFNPDRAGSINAFIATCIKYSVYRTLWNSRLIRLSKIYRQLASKYKTATPEQKQSAAYQDFLVAISKIHSLDAIGLNEEGDLSMSFPDTTQASRLSDQEEYELLYFNLAKLNDDRKAEALFMAFSGEYPSEEIAKHIGISTSTLSNWVFDGIAKLRKMYDLPPIQRSAKSIRKPTVCSQETKAMRQELNDRVHSHEWVVIKPDGTEVEVRNLKRFCEENKLNVGHLCAVAKGKLTHYKQWKCRKAEAV